MNRSIERYLKYICEEYSIYNKKYTKLLEFLLQVPFYCTLEEDEPRLEDGRFFRDDVVGYCGVSEREIDELEISVLEVLIELSIRIDMEYTGDPRHPYPESIFWELLNNLGLNKFTNRSFDSECVEEILDIWMNRKFERDGTGSIFPLGRTRRDQTRICIWDQMNEYVKENYR